MNTLDSVNIIFDTDDKYQRKSIGLKIIKLLNSDIDISPLIINGKWGSGKTIFCHKLIALIKQEHTDSFDPIYIDAFKDDHTDSPITTVISGVIASLNPSSSKAKKLIGAAIPIIRTITKIGLKAGSGWLLKQEGEGISDELKGAIKEASSELIDSSISSILKDNIEAQKNIEALKSVLSEISKEKNIILFIDELDRCRPDFAIQLLEDIKHIFDIENIKIILVANIDQLESSINHSYGISTNAKEYLDKFIKVKISLPNKLQNHNAPNRIQSNISYQHFCGLCNDYQLDLEGNTLELINELIEKDNLSLRQVEHYIRNIRICSLLKDDFFDIPDGILWMKLIGVYIQCFNKSLADKLLRGECEFEDVLCFFQQKLPLKYPDDTMCTWITSKLALDLTTPDQTTFGSKYATTIEQLQHDNTTWGVSVRQTSMIGRIKSTIEIITLENY